MSAKKNPGLPKDFFLDQDRLDDFVNVAIQAVQSGLDEGPKEGFPATVMVLVRRGPKGPEQTLIFAITGDMKAEEDGPAAMRLLGGMVWDQFCSVPTAALLACEAWTVDRKPGEVGPKPSEDPNRKECALIAAEAVGEQGPRYSMARMLFGRDKLGMVVPGRLERRQGERSGLLTYFWAGFVMAMSKDVKKMPDELARLLQRVERDYGGE